MSFSLLMTEPFVVESRYEEMLSVVGVFHIVSERGYLFRSCSIRSFSIYKME